MTIKQDKIIIDEKLVLRAAEIVWAKNKYFTLACSHRDYSEVRKLLRPGDCDLKAAYHILKSVHDKFRDVPTENLPQVSNALYHIAGYFKKLIPREDRQRMNVMIRTNPGSVIEELELYTQRFSIDYLLHSYIWPERRTVPFNRVPIHLLNNNENYQASELLWEGDYLTFKS